jgi:hypothetical protein
MGSDAFADLLPELVVGVALGGRKAVGGERLDFYGPECVQFVTRLR